MYILIELSPNIYFFKKISLLKNLFFLFQTIFSPKLYTLARHGTGQFVQCKSTHQRYMEDIL